ncbi:MAG: adenylyltransferase [Candidatus Lokiarchaeota archaeon]|nr:adenylyltransferase [Candidatus Lokiarchaeota archaeon]MBD3199621.1 adenylyltransferase [Candidatus Lokiarchaeota archaeon]
MLNENQVERYSRQILSENIGKEGQEKLSEIKVLQIGTGGLGSPCALYLTAAGIGELTIIDSDTVSLSNLQRQVLYNENDIGKIKIDSAKKRLTELNSNVKINAYNEYVDQNSIKKFVRDKDFIIDCSDNLKTKFLVNRTSIKYDIRAIIAGVKDFYGQILNINPKRSACYHCVFTERELHKSRDSPLPILGATAGILGAIEALEVIKTALGLENLENELLMVNLINMTFNKIKVLKDDNCVCCGI